MRNRATCNDLNCPFTPFCKEYDFFMDRGQECSIQRQIVEGAKMVERYWRIEEISNKNHSKIQVVKQIRDATGAGLRMCVDAYDYAGGDLPIAVAYVRAKSTAVVTPGLNFDQRVQLFLKEHGSDV